MLFGKDKKKAEVSPTDILASKIEELAAGGQLRTQLSKLYGGDMVVVERNEDSAKKRKKYKLGTLPMADGKPTGALRVLFEHDNPKALAKWIVMRGGMPPS
jgi:hypothetical protein